MVMAKVMTLVIYKLCILVKLANGGKYNSIRGETV